MTFELVARAPRRARFRVEIGALGRHSVQNALAAAAAGLVAGVATSGSRRASRRRGAAPRPTGASSSKRPALTILDDTYNASPPAMVAALEVLATLPGRPSPCSARCSSWARPTRRATARSARAAARSRGRARRRRRAGGAGIAAGAERCGPRPGRIHVVADRDAAARRPARRSCGPGDAVLVKASRGAALETVVEALRAGVPAPGRPRRDRRADPGDAPGVRDRGHHHARLHPPGPLRRLRQADPDRGPGGPPHEGRDAHGRRRADPGRRDRARAAVRPGRRLDLRAAGDPGPRRRRSASPTTGSTPGPATGSGPARSSCGRSWWPCSRRGRSRTPTTSSAIARPLRRRRRDRAVGLHRLRGLRDRGHEQRRQPDRRARRPGRRHPRLLVRRLPAHRPPQHPGPAEPRAPLRPAHRGPARLPLVQRPPGPGLHGRRRLALDGRRARRHRPHHRPDPDPAAHRAGLRHRDALGRSSRSATSR